MTRRSLLFTAAACLLLASTPEALAKGTDLGQGADGYSFGVPEFDRLTVRVTWIRLPDIESVKQLARDKGIRLPIKSRAFATIGRPPVDTCTIYSVAPDRVYRPEVYGHELVHCFTGSWHND